MASAHSNRMTGDCNLRKHSEQRFCCGGCSRAFASMEVFDWHRRGHVCTNPAEGGYHPHDIPGAVGTVTIWSANAEMAVPPPLPRARKPAEGPPGMTGHVCAECLDCIHDGRKCCGCYDGACCQSADWIERGGS